MRVFAKQLVWFVLTVFLLGLIVEVLTMQLPLAQGPSHLGQQISESFVMAALESLCALVGGSIAFRFYPRSRQLGIRQLFCCGLAFIVAAYAAATFLAPTGLAGILLALLLIAFFVITAAGRWMAPRSA
jgi:hypothetical protein